jgi:propanol-preferring alcohol dehydrogenase
VINSRSVDALAEVRRITGGLGVDAVIENVGTPETLSWTLPATQKGGRLIIVGYAPGRPFPLDTMAMHYNEWQVIGSRLASKQGLTEVVDLLNRGQIRPWVTKTLALEEADEALDLLERDAIVGRAALLL